VQRNDVAFFDVPTATTDRKKPPTTPKEAETTPAAEEPPVDPVLKEMLEIWQRLRQRPKNLQ
jgi:hypothetical protein